ncbi:PHD finger protein 24-like isoform X1 [Haliotis rufescens]|uniref:PHD finger protein 24-like isoform X1 n=1 Tax=Haliotis rufescens TaxID=6454 RepID=UPI00201E7587|nr:PHD finger protein 24-like isoform X1 [Haliotis rufescens]
MGSASSRRKSNKSKIKTVTLSESAHGSGKGKGSSKKGGKSKKSCVNNSSNDIIPWDSQSSSVKVTDRTRVFQRSKSEPAVKSNLNSSLSTSLRFSDFCKIVRKERVETDEIKPIYIPYTTTHKLTPDSLCHICSVYTGSEVYSCAVCYRVYHESCLSKIGQCQNEAVRYLHASQSASGWSCHLCDTVSNLLTEEEMIGLLDMFRKCNVTAGEDLTRDQYFSYRKQHYKGQLGTEMTSDELRDELLVVSQLSKGLTGRVSWSNFLNHESLKVLERRNKNSLVRYLSDPEIECARQMVKPRDKTGRGDVSRDDLLRLTSQFDQIFHVTYRQDKIIFADDDLTGSVNWERFLKDVSIFLIAGRLNIFRQAVAEAKKCAHEEMISQETVAKSTSSVTITTKPTNRKVTSRSLYVINSAYGRLLGDARAQKRPMSLA